MHNKTPVFEPQPESSYVWTIESYAIYTEALRQADIRFDEERDRRYTEVNIEREKALKIKETADRDAMALARESQTYKEQQNDALRDKNLADSGVYARSEDVDASIEKLAQTVNSQFEGLIAKLEPFMNGSISQQGQQQGSQITKANLYAAVGVIAALVGIYAIVTP